LIHRAAAAVPPRARQLNPIFPIRPANRFGAT